MRNRPYPYLLYLSEHEQGKLISDAKKAGISKAAYLRKLIEKKDVKARKPKEFYETLRLVANIANNVNQIAYVANINKFVTETDIQVAQQLVDMCWKHIKELE